MNFKKSSILVALMLTSFVFITSCNDDKKKEEQMKMETERVEKETAEKAEMAEMEAMKKEEMMKKEAMDNSIAMQATANSELKTLTAALNAAELSTMLSEPGNYTVFAPTENAFSKLPAGTVDNLLKPENKEQLQSVLQYHVVAGVITTEKLTTAIKGGKGSYTFDTVTGGKLTAMMEGDQIVIKDSRGKKAHIVQGNMTASNGMVYLIDNVLMAKK